MEDEIALSDVPLTPGGVNRDFRKVKQYNFVRFDPILSWRTLTLIGSESPPPSDDEEIPRKDIITEDDIASLLNSPMVEVRKKRSISSDKNILEAKYNPLNTEILDTSKGWHNNYEKSKRKTIAVMRRLSTEPVKRATRNSLPSIILSRQSNNIENIPPTEITTKQHLDLLITSITESRPLLKNDHIRLSATIVDWKHILQNEDDIPPEAQGSIQSTIGRTQILLDKRFKSTFEILDKAEDYINNKGKILNENDKEYKPDDIYAYVDLLINEIKNVDCEFSLLLKLRDNNWNDNEKGKIVNVPTRKKVKSKDNKNIVKSRIDISSFRKKFANIGKNDIENVDVKAKKNTGRRSSKIDSSINPDSSFANSDSQAKSPSVKSSIRKTIRSNCVIKSATGTPVHCDTPRPRKNSSKQHDFAVPSIAGKKRSAVDLGFMMAPVTPSKKTRRSRF